jgi:hypothetical protein
MCVEPLTLSRFVYSFQKYINISIVYCIASIIIRHSVFGTIRFTFSWFHIIFTGFLPIINATIITYVIRQYERTNTLGILCIASL